MADIANIGFSVDTSDLDVAVAKLNALKPAAAGVATASNSMARAVEGSSASVIAAATAIARAESQKATATLRMLQANASATKEEIAAARAIQLTTKANLSAAIAEENRVKALNAVANAQRKTQAANAAAITAQGQATKQSAVNPVLVVNNGPTIPRDQTPNRFNTANIAAQFHDIAVTAAMGMNPLQIALQQGTQLSAIMNSMENPVKGLAAAFKEVFNAISLGTIGVIALVAAMVELVNWITVGKFLLNGLADIIQKITPYVLGLTAALALIYAGPIIAGITSLSIAIIALGARALIAGSEMLAAWLIGLGPIGVLIMAIALLGSEFQMLGFNAVGYMKMAANGIIAAFVGAFNGIKAVWKMLPAVMGDLVIQAANKTLSAISNLINGFVSLVNDLIAKLPESMRPKDGKIVWKADVQITNPFKGEAAEAGKIAGAEFAKAFKQDYVGKGIATAQGLGNSAAKSIRDFASHLGDKKQKGKTAEELYDEVLNKADRQVATLKAQRDEIGMSEFETEKLKYQTELLNDAMQKNIDLTASGKAELMDRANTMAILATQTKELKDAYDFAKSSVKGFFSDMVQGLQQGKSVWESFGNAVVNVLNKILNKMMDKSIDMIFEGMGTGGGMGGGLLGSIFGAFGQSAGFAASPTGTYGPFQQFAKGGAFTNSIVDRKTPFSFANGSAFGQMGEAGPEAVMPLHRGPDGSLGVKAIGGGNGDGVTVNIINNSNAQASVQQRQTSNGMELDVMIDQVVAQKVSDQSSQTNRSLNINNNRRLISR